MGRSQEQSSPNLWVVICGQMYSTYKTLCTTWARTTTQQIPCFFRGGIKVPLYSHMMSLVEIRRRSKFLELYPKLVFWYGIGWYFLGM
jgi:hypothetical protein